MAYSITNKMTIAKRNAPTSSAAPIPCIGISPPPALSEDTEMLINGLDIHTLSISPGRMATSDNIAYCITYVPIVFWEVKPSDLRIPIVL
ncbi:hypothetical protein D3C73_1179570 [compost metagenome]